MTQVLQDVFTKFMANKPVFNNRDALSISFTPENIPHRDKQIGDLGRILAPALKGGRPSNVFMYGRTGTGKTCVAKLVGQELEKITKNNGNSIKVIYVNCKMKRVADTEYRLLARLIKEFGQDVPFTGLPTDRIYQIFFDVVDKKEQTIILIIDEIDVLVKKTGDDILYNLTRMNQDMKKAKISIIGITNDLSFIDNLDPRVKSSLGEEEMIFPPYNAVQLQDILRARANLAFEKDVIKEGVVEKCAALAAQEHGDARRALDLLRVSGELAERDAEDSVSVDYVDKAEDKIDLDRVVEIAKTQPRQSQAILWCILSFAEKNKHEIQTGDVFNMYQDICKQQGLKVLTNRRISDLIAELDMFGIIKTRVISKGRYGRTRIISLNVSDQVFGKMKIVLQENFL
ncbi:MAG: ORC1-type DNA replication protein [Candidatus Aenigmarchaeota archaeon]|nr:ORC1-type DNA replication protein [Candidatus Aenigmarchaeota archaeon]